MVRDDAAAIWTRSPGPIVRRAFDAGTNFSDPANIYSGWILRDDTAPRETLLRTGNLPVRSLTPSHLIEGQNMKDRV